MCVRTVSSDLSTSIVDLLMVRAIWASLDVASGVRVLNHALTRTVSLFVSLCWSPYRSIMSEHGNNDFCKNCALLVLKIFDKIFAFTAGMDAEWKGAIGQCTQQD